MMDRNNWERRHIQYGRRGTDQECPITPECAEKILSRLGHVEEKVTELHDRLLQAKGFVTGARFGAASVFVLLVSLIVFIFAVLTGKVSIKDVISGLF